MPEMIYCSDCIANFVSLKARPLQEASTVRFEEQADIFTGATVIPKR
jgi:hypothetical protein